MNLFLLSRNCRRLAKYHCNKHVVKMILEATQMLYTAHHVLQSNDEWITSAHEYLKGCARDTVYRKAHVNHPISKWVRSHKNNYMFACRAALALCAEYTFRYSRQHACYFHLKWLKRNAPENFKEEISPTAFYATRGIPSGCTRFPLAMPADYHCQNAVRAYRNYYRGDKKNFAKWPEGMIPKWFSQSNN